MTNPIAEELTREGIAAYRAGERERAHGMLLQALELDPRQEMAWLWLVMLVPTPGEQRYCLERALELNPDRAMIRERIDRLGDVAPVAPHALAEGAMAAGSGMDQADVSLPMMASEAVLSIPEPTPSQTIRPETPRAAMPQRKPRSMPWWMIAVPLIALVGLVGVMVGMVVVGGPNSITALIAPPTPTPVPPPPCGVQANAFIEQAGAMLDAVDMADGGAEAAPENRVRLETLQQQVMALDAPACVAPARRTLLKMIATAIDAFQSVENGELQAAQVQFGLVALSEAEYRSKVDALRTSAALPTGTGVVTVTAAQIRSAYEARQFTFETEDADQGRQSIRGSLGDGPQSIRVIGELPEEITFFTSVADGTEPTEIDQYLALVMPDWNAGPGWVRARIGQRGYNSVIVGQRMVTMLVFRPGNAPGSVVAVLIEPMGP